MSLDRTIAQSFLAEAHIAVLAVNEPDRPPLAVPVWYFYQPGGDVEVLTGTDSRKAKALRATSVATLVVDTVVPRVRYVSIACTVEDERPGGAQDERALAERYLPPEQIEPYLAGAAERPGGESIFTLRPRRWLSADLTV